MGKSTHLCSVNIIKIHNDEKRYYIKISLDSITIWNALTA